MPGQHHHRGLDALFAHQPAQFAPVGVGQPDIEDHQIVDHLLDLAHRVRAVGGFEHVEILGHHQLFAERLAQIVVVIDKQYLLDLGHCEIPSLSGMIVHLARGCDKGGGGWLTPTCCDKCFCFNLARNALCDVTR